MGDVQPRSHPWDIHYIQVLEKVLYFVSPFSGVRNRINIYYQGLWTSTCREKRLASFGGLPRQRGQKQPF